MWMRLFTIWPNPTLVSLYALINKMRVVSNPGVAERADKVVRIIVDTYALPNKSFQEGARADGKRGRWTLCATSARLATKNFLVSLPKPYNSNIVVCEPISSLRIEGLRRSLLASGGLPALSKASAMDARRRGVQAKQVRYRQRNSPALLLTSRPQGAPPEPRRCIFKWRYRARNYRCVAVSFLRAGRDGLNVEIERHRRIRSTSLSVISSFVRRCMG
jgi:hypothetical protein